MACPRKLLPFGFTAFVSAIFAVYVGYSLHGIYELFHPEVCTAQHAKSDCLLPMIAPNDQGEWPALQLRIYTSIASNPDHVVNKGNEVHRIAFLDITESIDKRVQIDVPSHTRNNGTLYAHVFLLPADCKDVDPYKSEWRMVKSVCLTEYRVPSAETFQLMAGSAEPDELSSSQSMRQLRASGTPVTHIRSVLPLTVAAESPLFLKQKVPAEIHQQLQLTVENGLVYYWPFFFINRVSFREKDLVHVKPSTDTVDLQIQYKPVSIGKFRLLISALMTFEAFRDIGFSDRDIDEVKGIYADTSFYLLAATTFVASSHIFFDILAFKNDISFWRNRKNMVGLSTRAVLWRCFSQLIIVVYLFDQKTSLLVLIPSGVGVIVEAWKVTKALRMTITFKSGIPRISYRTASVAEAQTDDFDSEAMKYLIYLLIPLCIGGSLYSLAYIPHKSWYSWIIQCAANGVYAFGFLFMMPQLFLNYKLKSVAHLPWKAFMYKAFNTFIDDMFAFIITMPTAHRMACFRDDFVFLIYLYQRYLYPVDKTRANEFGESFEEQANESKKTK
ncbi:hypothetical protein QR680_001168 [Steinernema hermaphroditum]|uniref:Lipid scramblase CLPTM1L n=1 Tax=Steinernema hermaphroditum TaxID=289476 RepID=A0AA39GXA3_9BILA|nr:hypothetical protein QR680_001168 [Steinernema hermaphroditum]